MCAETSRSFLWMFRIHDTLVVLGGRPVTVKGEPLEYVYRHTFI